MHLRAIDPQPDNRREQRTNLFALGTLSTDTIRQSVRIRNLSPAGALVEAKDVPPERSEVTLSRNGSCVDGIVIWRQDFRAGIEFTTQVCVEEWLPQRSAAQNRVDNIVAALRIGGGPVEASSIVEQPDPERMAAALDKLADMLAADKVVIARHAHSLQTLDIVSQGLRKLAVAATP